MNPNPTIDNDLQKAIDDITNNTNNDPVFGYPVAAPAPMPTPALTTCSLTARYRIVLLIIGARRPTNPPA